MLVGEARGLERSIFLRTMVRTAFDSWLLT